jgi:hypothetical protein
MGNEWEKFVRNESILILMIRLARREQNNPEFAGMTRGVIWF